MEMWGEPLSSPLSPSSSFTGVWASKTTGPASAVAKAPSAEPSELMGENEVRKADLRYCNGGIRSAGDSG